MGHVNKVSHVFTLGHVAEEMDTEDGQLWVVGVGEDRNPQRRPRASSKNAAMRSLR